VGTSEASPLYAALIAIMNANLGFNLGYLNPTFYQCAKTPGWLTFYDIADNGSNAFSFTLAPPNPPTTITSPGYLAVTGWDAWTGLGSIRARRLYAALAGLPIAASAIAGGGDFGPVCVGAFVDRLLTINNSGFGLLAITAITSSSGNFITPFVLSYPLLVAAGASIDLVIRFQPSVEGPDPASLTIASNDPSSPLTIPVTGEGGLPRLVLVMADTGRFPATCVRSFHDKPVILSNSSHCPLSVINVTSTSADFILPEVLSSPSDRARRLTVSAGPVPAGRGWDEFCDDHGFQQRSRQSGVDQRVRRGTGGNPQRDRVRHLWRSQVLHKRTEDDLSEQHRLLRSSSQPCRTPAPSPRLPANQRSLPRGSSVRSVPGGGD
jgi:hypothetical protein